MPRKRYARVQQVIESLQREDFRGDWEAVHVLIGMGPLSCRLPLWQALGGTGKAPTMRTFRDVIGAVERQRAEKVSRMEALKRGTSARPARPVDVVQVLATLRAELLAWLRGIASARNTGRWSGQMRIDQPLAFSAFNHAGQLMCDVDGSLRDVAVLQFLLLLHKGGLENLHLCAATDCPGPRLFFKTYRREFCSSRCQKRMYMLHWREQQRAQAGGRKRSPHRAPRRNTKGVSD